MDTRRLQRILEEKGLNQKQMAKLCDMTEASVSRLFSGKRSPNLATCQKIKDGLGLDTNTAYSIFFK